MGVSDILPVQSKFLLGLGIFYFISLFFSISAMELTQGVLVVWAIYFAIENRKQKLFESPPLKIIALLILAWVISTFISSSQAFPSNFTEVFSEFRWVITFVAFYLVFISQSIYWTKNWWNILPYLMLIMGLYSVFQTYVGIDLVHSSNRALHSFMGLHRAAGTFDNPMTFAQSYGLILMMFAGLNFSNALKLKAWERWMGYSGVLLCLVMSMVRGMWIGASLGLLLMSFLVGRKLFSRVLVVLILIASGIKLVLPGFYDRAKSSVETEHKDNTSRQILWKTYLEIWKTSPVFGVGIGQGIKLLPEYYEKLGVPKDSFQGEAHNQYIEFLSAQGLIGLFSYLGIVFYIFWISTQLWRKRNEWSLNEFEQGIVLGCMGLTLTCFFCGFFEDNFDDSEVRNVILWVWGAIIYLYITKNSKQQLIKN